MATWVCRLHMKGATRPGVLARVSTIFAERGISLDELLATTWRSEPLILIRFGASERMRDYMLRRLRRLAEVQSAEALAADEQPLWCFLP
jgi:acetolactate synthase small subunit